MKVIKKIKNTENITIVDYPRKDEDPIKGLDKNIEYYKIIESAKPNINELYNIIQNNEFTTTSDDSLNICYITYSTERKTNEQIISIMNKSLGDYLDTNFPIWKRNKYALELITFLGGTDTPEERGRMISDFFGIINECRDYRDFQEENLINTNTIPSLDWTNIDFKKK